MSHMRGALILIFLATLLFQAVRCSPVHPHDIEAQTDPHPRSSQSPPRSGQANNQIWHGDQSTGLQASSSRSHSISNNYDNSIPPLQGGYDRDEDPTLMAVYYHSGQATVTDRELEDYNKSWKEEHDYEAQALKKHWNATQHHLQKASSSSRDPLPVSQRVWSAVKASAHGIRAVAHGAETASVVAQNRLMQAGGVLAYRRIRQYHRDRSEAFREQHEQERSEENEDEATRLRRLQAYNDAIRPHRQ